MSTSTQEKTFEMSLRLWSDEIPLDGFARTLGLESGVQHTSGQPMAGKGVLSKRIAKRHYLVLGEHRSTMASDVDRWLGDVLKRIGTASDLREKLVSGRIEGTLWIALFGGEQSAQLALAEASVQAARDAHLSVLIEDYTDTEVDDFPRQDWLVAPSQAERR